MMAVLRGRTGSGRVAGAAVLAASLLGGLAYLVWANTPSAAKVTRLGFVVEGPCACGPSSLQHRVGIEMWLPEEGTGALPLLLYAPGWGSPVEANASLLAALAEKGFVVAAIDRVQPSVGSFDFSSAIASARTNALADHLVVQGAREASFVLDQLTDEGSRQLPPGLPARIDAGRVGILGYSFGGAIAAEAARLDTRFGAVLNLDGWLFGEVASEGFPAPYMLVTSSLATPPPAELEADDPGTRFMARRTEQDTRHQRRLLATRGGYSVEIARAKHASFTDVPWPRRLLWTATRHPSRLTAEVVGHYAGAFFLHHLTREDGGVLRASRPFGPGIRFTIWSPAESAPAARDGAGADRQPRADRRPLTHVEESAP